MVELDDWVLSDWQAVECFLPKGWKAKMHELGLLKFGRKFTGKEGESALLRTMLIHLAGNISMRSTCVIAREGGVADISDVALLKRIQKSARWFTWATEALIQDMELLHQPPAWSLFSGYNLRIADSTRVEEPGATGSAWRLHYTLAVPSLKPDELKVTDISCGDKLSNFTIGAKDLVMADSAYMTRKSIAYVSNHGGFVLGKFVPHNLPLHTPTDAPFQLLRHLRKLKPGEVGDFSVHLRSGETLITPARICAMRRSPQALSRALAKLKLKSSKEGRKTNRAQTCELAEYHLIVTTLPAAISAEAILGLYRYRWQIELLFKRLKSILGLSPLHKRSEDGMRGWLSGKVFTATLIESILWHAERFSPSGYPCHCRHADT